MKTGRYNLIELFTNQEIEQIIIPELQRDYVWEARNVNGLLNSILSNYNGREKLSLSIVDESKNEAIDAEIVGTPANPWV